MSPEFATALADMRLLQTARLLEWLQDNVEADAEAVRRALAAVLDAHGTIRGLRRQTQTAEG
jgi:hypothetical protein